MKDKKVLVVGAAGMLGTEVVSLLQDRGVNYVAAYWPTTPDLDSWTLDITDEKTVEHCISDVKPDILINCSAYTNVDGAEEQEQLATEVNGRGVGHLARACLEHDCLLGHVSTDYVFNGRATDPYHPDDPVDPQSAYGRSKLAGERAIQDIMGSDGRWFIVRTSWLFGRAGKNFVDNIIRLARDLGELKVVNDQYGCPTHAPDLARCLCDLAEGDAYGLFHFCNPPACSWHELAYHAIRYAGVSCQLVPCSTAEFPRPAPRPAYSVLDCTETFDQLGWSARPWREVLVEHLKSTLQYAHE